MSAAIAPTGEAALVQTIDVPYRVEVADPIGFFDLANVATSLADLVPHLTTLVPLQSSPNGGSAPDQATPERRDGDASQSQRQPRQAMECRVALQFPDELLFVSDAVVSAMFTLMDDLTVQRDSLKAIQFDFVILADTQYSACCVDEVAAQHIAANVLVHFGRSCLSQASHMPVLFAFGNFPIDVDHVAQSLADVPTALVIYDVMYAHAMPALAAKVAPTVRFATIERRVSSTDGSTHYTRNLPTKEELDADTTVVVIGPPSPLVSHYSLVFGQHSLLHYDPLSRECSRPRSLLMKRYALMTKARDADIIGIVVGTLGVANYIDMIANLKKLIKSHGKKYYTFVLGKLNVAKLANFSEIDIFVLVACPESSLIDSKEFYRPVVTPFELTMALDMSSSWTGEYRLGFTDVMHHMEEHMGDEPVDGLDQPATVATSSSKPAAADAGADSESDADPDQPYFSLVTGTFKSRTKVENNETIHAKIQDLTLYESGQVALVSPAAARQLQTREWRGLEMTPSAEKSLEVVEGRFGTAAGYADEPENLTLYTVKALILLDVSNGSRVLAKYYNTGAPSNAATSPAMATGPAPTATEFATLKDQKAFERRLWEKTRKLLSNEIILFDNHVVVYKGMADVMLFVVGSLEENELMLSSVLNTLYEAINLVLLKYQTEKRTIIENMDLVALAIDECIDNGIVIETDPGTIASRVSKRPSELADISFNDPNSISGAMNKVRDSFFAGILLK
ncbi:Diphthamide biosynthesis protein 2 [Allomyces javanicus]|nr:Diphthamide biosynthesis protein 2 [Allomyces javanicus]